MPRRFGNRSFVLCAAVAVLLGGLPWPGSQSLATEAVADPFAAAIVDQLSATEPNSTFLNEATQALEAAGYKVDYYPSEQVTVDLFHRLQDRGYGILVLRTHATAAKPESGSTRWTQPTVGIFTNELYVPGNHWADIASGGLSRVAYTPEQWNTTHQTWYAIRPAFVHDQPGRFAGTWVIAMGCRTLDNSSMADAFLMKGAGAYVGWNKNVTADWSDATAAFLLQQVLVQNRTVEQAVQDAEARGPDPVFGATMEVLGLPAFRPQARNR